MSEEVAKLEVEDVYKILKEFGNAFCMILEFLPSKELSFPVRVNDECTLLLTISKK